MFIALKLQFSFPSYFRTILLKFQSNKENFDEARGTFLGGIFNDPHDPHGDHSHGLMYFPKDCSYGRHIGAF